MDALDMDFSGVIQSLLRQATIINPIVTSNYQGMARESHAIPPGQTFHIIDFALVGPDNYLVDFSRFKIAQDFTIVNHRLFGTVLVGDVKHIVLVRVYDVKFTFTARAKPTVTFITRQDGHNGARRFYQLHGAPCKHYEVIMERAMITLKRAQKLISHFGVAGINARWFTEIHYSNVEVLFSRFVIEQLAREKADKGNDVPHYPAYNCFTQLLHSAMWQVADYTAMVTRYS